MNKSRIIFTLVGLSALSLNAMEGKKVKISNAFNQLSAKCFVQSSSHEVTKAYIALMNSISAEDQLEVGSDELILMRIIIEHQGKFEKTKGLSESNSQLIQKIEKLMRE